MRTPWDALYVFSLKHRRCGETSRPQRRSDWGSRLLQRADEVVQ